MAWMPYSLTLPVTMPENARRRLAASSCGGWPRCSCSDRIDSWVTVNGSWNSRRIDSNQLKL